jgi:hypothetical protein
MRTLLHKLIGPISIAALLLLPCGRSRAPLIDVDGSFMPSWMICLLGGIVAAGFTQWRLQSRKMQQRVMPAVVFYPSMVVATACLLWLLFF